MSTACCMGDCGWSRAGGLSLRECNARQEQKAGGSEEDLMFCVRIVEYLPAQLNSISSRTPSLSWGGHRRPRDPDVKGRQEEDADEERSDESRRR